MQAIFFAHGPFAKSLKDATAQSGFSSRRGWLSTEPHVMHSPYSHLRIFGFGLTCRFLQFGGLLSGRPFAGAGRDRAAT